MNKNKNNFRNFNVNDFIRVFLVVFAITPELLIPEPLMPYRHINPPIFANMSTLPYLLRTTFTQLFKLFVISQSRVN